MEKILVIQNEEVLYASEVSKDEIILRHSKSEIWTEQAKNKNIGHVKDTGNHIKIKLGDVKLKLDYSEFVELFTLMELKIDSVADRNVYVKEV
jgi:hypothetical protein